VGEEVNPYEPPKADVAEVAESHPARPRPVNIALGLIGGALLFQLLSFVYTLQQVDFRIANPQGFVVRAAMFVIMGLLCHQIARRKSWPRLILLILTLVGFAQFCWALGAAFKYLSGEELWGLMLNFLFFQGLPLAMNLAAMHLLFLSSSKWFR
jgi:hypothetical protein